LLQDPQISSHNRGFAFVEYYNNACAEYSRQKMANSNFKLGSNAPTVGLIQEIMNHLQTLW